MTKLARLDAEQRPEEVIERLLRDDIEPVLPWFGSRFAQCWSRELETRWKTLERFHRLNTGMVTYFQALLEVARNKNRRDLLIPILNFFQDHFQGDNIEDLWQKEFNRLARDLRFADRDTYRRTWGSAIRMGWTLYEEYGEARSIHPIDRESADRVFMEVFEKQEFEQTAERARVLSNALNSVIS